MIYISFSNIEFTIQNLVAAHFVMSLVRLENTCAHTHVAFDWFLLDKIHVYVLRYLYTFDKTSLKIKDPQFNRSLYVNKMALYSLTCIAIWMEGLQLAEWNISLVLSIWTNWFIRDLIGYKLKNIYSHLLFLTISYYSHYYQLNFLIKNLPRKGKNCRWNSVVAWKKVHLR